MEQYRRLRDLAQYDGVILLTCNRCGHRGWVSASEVWGRLGHDEELTAVHFRCKHCNNRFPQALVYFPGWRFKRFG